VPSAARRNCTPLKPWMEAMIDHWPDDFLR
jgi:hypothetical protein